MSNVENQKTEVNAGRVALVTGASRGIGRAVAVSLLQAGYRVALLARTAEGLMETARLGAGESLSLVVDVADPDAVQIAIESVAKRFGQIDALINVAGVAPVATIESMTPAAWREVLDVNLSAVFYVTKFAWPHLRASAQRGNQPTIVNVSSISARDPFPGFAAYGAAKAGLNVFDKVAAREGQADGITVHTIAPGAVETEMFRKIVSVEKWSPEKTLRPQEVANVILDCIEGRLRHASGEVIHLQNEI